YELLTRDTNGEPRFLSQSKNSSVSPVPPVALSPAPSHQDSGSYMISRTSCAHRHAAANFAAHIKASSRDGTSRIAKPPRTALVSGNGPALTVPPVSTLVAC